MTGHRYAGAVAALLLAAGIPAVQAAGTAAGTDITNVAEATYTDPNGNPQVARSNGATLRVDELLDVTVVGNDAGIVLVASPDADAVLSFTLTNTGNGDEAFALSFDDALAGDDYDPANVRIYLDNGDGILDPLADTLYVRGANDPLLAADQSRVVFVAADIPAGLANSSQGQVRIGAEAVTVLGTPGADSPGVTFAGAGAGGSDAVVGSSGADDNLQNGFLVSDVAAALQKSQVVLDPFGGNNPVPGATITYTLTFSVTGSGTLTGLRISDPVPANTTYVPGSIRHNGTALTDVVDADAGRFTGSVVDVDVGSVVAPSTSVVTFQVTIN